MEVISGSLNYLLDIVYPPRCPGCDGILPISQKLICTKCKNSFKYVSEPRCKKCSKQIQTENQEFCYDCTNSKHYFDRGISVFYYEEKIKKSIYQFKYNGRREYSNYYAAAMSYKGEGFVKRCKPDIIIPIPLYKARRNKRGFNQAALLARKLSAYHKVPYEEKTLIRKNNTIPQKGLNNRDRRNNVMDKFEIRGKWPNYSRVLLVDDIYTTGSTIDAAAKVLKESGAVYVFFITLCISSGM